MEILKSKTLVIFLILVLGITIINSINTRKYDELNEKEGYYLSMNTQ